jgi:hypothetical protein
MPRKVKKVMGSESSAEKEVPREDIFTGVAEEEEQEEDFMLDERNDIYTAKGGGATLQVPVTAGTKSQSSLRGGGRLEGQPAPL